MGTTQGLALSLRWWGLGQVDFAWPGPWLRPPGRRGRLAASLAVSLVIHLLMLAPKGPAVAPQPPTDPLPAKFLRPSRPQARPLHRRTAAPTSLRPLVRVPQSVAHLPPQLGAAASPAVREVSRPLILQLQAISAAAALPVLAPVRNAVGPLAVRAGRVAGSRRGAASVDLSSELMDVGSMDTGRHGAVVLVDPRDPRRLKGRLSLARVRSELLDAAEEGSPYPRRGSHASHVSRAVAESEALVRLARLMSEHTAVRTEVVEAVALDDERLQRQAFLLITANDPFTLSSPEMAGLGRYLTGGGFLYAESVGFPRPAGNGYTTDNASLRRLIRQALRAVGLAEGQRWRFRRLDSDESLYHCYYNVSSLPMGFWDTTASSFMTMTRDFVWSPDYLEAIEVDGEVVGLYSQKDFCDYWAGVSERFSAGQAWSGYPARMGLGGEEIGVDRLGINILVYALTREGSVAQQVVAVE